MIGAQPITKLEDAISLVSNQYIAPNFRPNFHEFGLWFRGQTDFNWCLTPSLFPRATSTCYQEEALYYEFTLRNARLDNGTMSVFDWACTMQHYGLPTRLLDWSENMLVALYFAVKDEIDTVDGALYLLDAHRLTSASTVTGKGQSFICTPTGIDVALRALLLRNRHTHTLAADLEREVRLGNAHANDALSLRINSALKGQPFIEDQISMSSTELLQRALMPIPVIPKRMHERLVSQAGTFTLHSGKPQKIDSNVGNPGTIEQIDGGQGTVLLKYKIPGLSKGPIKRQLSRVGIDEATLFPDLDHQASAIMERWRVN